MLLFVYMLLQGLSQLVAAGGAAVAAVNAAQFCGNFLDGKSFYQDADSFKIAGAAVDESNIMDLAVNDVIIYLLRAGAAGFVRIHKNYLVNVKSIEEVGVRTVRLFNGMELDMGKNRRKEITEIVNR